uniref:Uncharacterized protein n=1 Tax=Meloidogyne floridensis TaxID=298350 RepID=A0A915NCW7_9BILA
MNVNRQDNLHSQGEPSELKTNRLKRINETIADFKIDEEFYKEKVRKTKEEYEDACQNLNGIRCHIEGTCYAANAQLTEHTSFLS